MPDFDLRPVILANVAHALLEDLGPGDLTAALLPAASRAKARILSRQAAVLCGTAWAEACLRALDPGATIRWHKHDGERLAPGEVLCDIEADARALLSAERCALNFLQTLSGTATRTRRFVDAVAGLSVRIMDTRKTLPGLRMAQKYAVRTGGGDNQRAGLFDGILVKENHIRAAGGIGAALAAAAHLAPPGVPVQIEVENLDQLEEALAHGARLVLLDNFDIESLAKAVAHTAGRAELEASGGITLENVRAVAQTGVSRISIGSLTKDLEAVDLSLRVL